MNIREIESKSILTKSPVHGNYSANPYVGCPHRCLYCYAEYMRNWTGHECDRWGNFVDVKNWQPIKHPERLKGQSVFISSATDPYQPMEAKYRRTRLLLEQLKGTGMEVTIVTKSDLVLRDMDLLKELDATVALSINTLDDGFRSDMDCACSIERRLSALEELHHSGIHAVCFISPIFPGITRPEEIIPEVTGMCSEVWLEYLVLNYPYKGPVLFYVRTRHPELYQYYDTIYNQGDKTPWRQFDEYMAEWCRDNGYEYGHGTSAFDRVHRSRPVVINMRGHKDP